MKATTTIRHHGLAILVLCVLVCLSYPGWFSPQGLSFDDLTRLNAPQRVFLGQMIKTGHLAFWNPFNFGGQPFLAAGQSGPLYPLNVLFAILPITAALKVSYALHAMLAAVSMYLIGYHLTRHRLPAITSGMVFVTSGFMLGHQIHTQMYDAISLVPLCLLFLLRVLDRPTIGNTIGLSIAIALEVYAGHPQITFYLIILLFVSCAVVLFSTWSQGFLTRFTLVSTSGILGVLLSAPQWLPTVALIPYSDRSMTSNLFLLKSSLPWSGLYQFLAPFTAGGGYTGVPLAHNFQSIYGSPLFWEMTCYVGLSALCLSVVAICSNRLFQQPIVVALLLLGLFGVLLALGKHGPFTWILLHAPGFDLFRIPSRYTVLTQIAIAILSAIGIEVLVEARQNRRTTPVVVLSICTIAAICTLVYARFWGPLSSEPALAMIVPCVIALIMLVFNWLLWFARSGRHPDRAATIRFVFSFIVWADVISQANGWSAFVMGSPAGYTSPTAVDTFLKTQLQSLPTEQVAAMPDTSLAFDQSSAFGIRALNGYDSLEASWYVNNVDLTWSTAGIFSQPRSFMDALGVRYLLTTNSVNPLWAIGKLGETRISKRSEVPAGASALKVHVGAVLAPEVPLYTPLISVTLEAGNKHLTQLLSGMGNQQFLVPLPNDWPRQTPTTIILRNETWQEQVQLNSVTWLTTKPSTMPLMDNVWLQPEPWEPVYSDDKETVWQNQAASPGVYVTANPSDPLTDSTGLAHVISTEPSQQVWQVTTTEPANLVLGQTFDPGWRATVDGRPTSVFQCASLYGNMMTGVKVPRGKHIVRLSYRPLGFESGVIMFFTGLLLMVGLVSWQVVRLNRRRHPRL